MNKIKFTFIEVLVIISFVGVVIAIILPAIDSGRPSVKNKIVIRRIISVMNAYYDDHGDWPHLSDWKTQLNVYFHAKEDQERLYVDTWGNPIKYMINDNDGEIKRFLYSFGKNGIDENGKGDDIIAEVSRY